MSISLRSNSDGSGTLLNGSTPVMEITAAGVVSLPNIAAGSSANQPVNKGQMDTAIAAAAPTTTQVLNATAGAAVGGVGTYAFLGMNLSQAIPGSNYSGSQLYYAFLQGSDQYSMLQGYGNALNFGTWKAMSGAVNQGFGAATLFLRIA